MASKKPSDFEPSFGSRSTEPPLEPRLRDRHVRPDDGDDTSTRELVDAVDRQRTVGEAVRAGRVAGEPMLSAAATGRSAGQSPAIPIEGQERAAKASGDATPAAGSSKQSGTRWSRIRRRLVAGLAAAVVLGTVYFLVPLLGVWPAGGADDDGPVDAIVVMGAAQYDGRPSPQLAARLDHVVEIWPEGVAPLVVVTGGNIPGDRFTEAEASANYLIERGIPTEAILLENVGSNSQESLTAVSVMLSDRGVDEVLIVTDPYHALRSRLIAEELGLDASVSSTDTSVVTGGENMKRLVQEAGGVAIGRIIGFERLSDLVD